MDYCGESATIGAFCSGFQQTVSRGPDDSKIVDTGKGLLGFHRLAIMGLHPEGMQPFRFANSYVVCNGEIYGFEKSNKACPINIRLKTIRTVRCCCRCIRNTERICSLCWKLSLR